MIKILLAFLSLSLSLCALELPPFPEAAQEKIIDQRENYFLTSTDNRISPRVNPITGEYCEESLDLVIAGGQPLSLRRFYNHRAPYEGRYGAWRYNPESFFAANFDLRQQELFAAVGEADGSVISFKEQGSHFHYAFDLPQSFAHFIPGGQNHPLNTKINYQTPRDPKDFRSYQYVGSIKDGTGRERIFISPRHRWVDSIKYESDTGTFWTGKTIRCKILPATWTPYQIPIVEEKLPNGNVIAYTYKRWKKELPIPLPQLLHSITAYNSDKSKVLATLEFEYSKNKKKEITAVRVRGSDGRQAYIQHQGDPRLVYYGEKPQEETTFYTYNDLHITSVRQADRDLLTTEYREDRVVQQQAPVGPQGEMCPIARYEYQPGATLVYDAEGHKKRYCYDAHQRLTSLESYQGDSLYSTERYSWEPETGNLLSKSLEDAAGKKVHSVEYLYDKNHNPIEEKRGDGSEWHKIFRTFSEDGFNLLLSESDREGRTLRHSYRPNTNLLLSTLVYDKEKIRARTFYTYDDCANCIRRVVDDGSSVDVENLEKVTYRKITEIYPRTELPCYGLPEILCEMTIDKEGREILLKKVIYFYTPAGKVLQEVHFDAQGNHAYTLKNSYDAKERLVSQSDALGNVTKYNYDQHNNLTSTLGPKEQKKEFYYDASNRPVRIRERHNRGYFLTTQKHYNKLGQVIAEIDTCYQTTLFNYDSLGRLIKTTYPDQTSTSLEYDLMGNVTKEIDAAGYITTRSYNFRGLPIEVHYPDGTSEHFTYTPQGLLDSQKDREGRQTFYTYDIFDHCLSVETREADRVLKRVESSYSSFQKMSDTDAEGVTTHYTYDFAGRKLSEQRGAHLMRYSYDHLGRLACTQEGNVKYYQEYDALDRLIETRTENGKILLLEQKKYNATGQCIELITAGGTTYTEYNCQGLPLLIRDPLGFETHLNYHHTLYVTECTTSPKGIVSETQYDCRGRVARVCSKNAEGKMIQQSHSRYDSAGNLVEITYDLFPSGSPIKHTWHYGPMGRLERFIEAGKRQTSYEYDAAGRVKSIIKPNGVSLHHEYDALGRLSRFYATDFDYRYTYDKNDRITCVVDVLSRQECRRKYDAFGNLTEETLGNGLSLRSTYDQEIRRVLLELPDRTTVSYSYCGPHLYTVSYQGHTHTYTQRDLAGNILSANLPASLGNLLIERDALFRPTSIKAPGYSQQNSYDAVGNILHLQSHDLLGPISNSYLYDDLDHLIQENNHTYLFDSLDNRLKKDGAEHQVNDLCQITHDGQQAYEYDLAGNLLFDGARRYTYDSLDRLILVQEGAEQTLYTYDPFNRRLAERYGKRESYFLWDDQNEIGRFEKGECRELRILGEGLGAEIGAAVLYKLHNFYYVPIHDQRGSVVSLIDVKLQQPKECYRYSAFGEELLPHTLSPWRFSSKRVDRSGLVYFGRRYYHPTLGRWTTTDPEGFEDGPNLYAYLHNDPLTDIDLYGLFSFTPLWEAGKGFSKGVGLGAWDTATGLWDLGNYASSSAMNWSSAGCSALRGDSIALRAQSARFSQGFNTLSSTLLQDPLGSAKGLLRAALPGIYAACSLPADATLAQRAEALGRASFDIGSIVCGARAASLASSINALRTSISVQKSAALLSHEAIWTSRGAESSIAGIRLNAKLASQEISAGHAFAKHAAEFGFQTREQMAKHIENVIFKPSQVRSLSAGRTAFWDNKTKSIVVRVPQAIDGGTTFIPSRGIRYFYEDIH